MSPIGTARPTSASCKCYIPLLSPDPPCLLACDSSIASAVRFCRVRVGIKATHNQSTGCTVLQATTGNNFSVSEHEKTVFFHDEKTPTEEHHG